MRTQRDLRRIGALLLAVLLATTACGSPAPSSTAVPSGSPAPTLAPATASPLSPTRAAPSATAVASPSASASASASPAPSASPSDPPSAARLLPGALAMTVADDVRVRSQPRVSADSQLYSPTLASNTKLVVTGGPVVANGYTWIEVGLASVTLKGGVDRGWVAVADHDGTPWVAVDKSAVIGFDTAAATSKQVSGTLSAAKREASQANAFGLDLYRKLNGGHKGMVFSPTSIVDALAMARAGANGTTGKQMDAVLHASGWDQLSLGIASLDQQLKARNGTWTDGDGNVHALSLHLANTVFAQKGFPIEPTYLKRMGQSFGAGIQLVDFVANTKGAINAINGWVRTQTLGKIPVIVGPDNITPDTRLALVNAIYLKANWVREFDPTMTVKRPFTLFDGKVVSVPTMRLWGEQAVALARGTGWKATELYYRGPGGTTPLSMTLILPSSLTNFEKALSPSLLATVESRIHAQEALLQRSTTPQSAGDCGTYAYQVDLRLPKFGVDAKAELASILGALGMPYALSPSTADFTGMSPERPLFIGDVVHKATIDVDEKGTTAAAATVVSMDTGGCTGPEPAKTVILAFNHPFFFYIRDLRTGAILFIGRVTDPSQR